jgi:hypothetical protein
MHLGCADVGLDFSGDAILDLDLEQIGPGHTLVAVA